MVRGLWARQNPVRSEARGLCKTQRKEVYRAISSQTATVGRYNSSERHNESGKVNSVMSQSQPQTVEVAKKIPKIARPQQVARTARPHWDHLSVRPLMTKNELVNNLTKSGTKAVRDAMSACVYACTIGQFRVSSCLAYLV